jgi:hypothetical protein
VMDRDDVWQLQLLKRATQGRAEAVRAIRSLMELERSTGQPLRASDLAGRQSGPSL